MPPRSGSSLSMTANNKSGKTPPQLRVGPGTGNGNNSSVLMEMEELMPAPPAAFTSGGSSFETNNEGGGVVVPQAVEELQFRPGKNGILVKM